MGVKAGPDMGKIEVNEQYCKGCGLCVTSCPQKLIQIADHVSEPGYRPAKLEDPQGKCTACAICAFMCPDAAITVYREKRVTGDKK